MLMEIQQLRYLAAVAQYGKVKDAAEALFVSRQAISKALTQLEAELGQPLFIRTHNGIVLNERGHRFLSRVDTLVRDFDALHKEMLEANEICRLRLCFPFTTQHYFWNVLNRFLNEHTSWMKVDVISCLDAQCHTLFESGVVDIAVSLLRFDSGIDEGRLVATSPMLIGVNQKNALAGKRFFRQNDLAHVPRIYYMNGYEELFWLEKNCPKPDYMVNDILLAFNLVREDKGVFPVPALSVLQPMEGIVFIPYHGPNDRDDFYCAINERTGRDKRRRRACLALRDALTQSGGRE